LVNQQLFGQYIPNTNKQRISMTAITKQENIETILNSKGDDDTSLINKETTTTQSKETQSRIHTFLTNISNKLGLSNAIYFK